MRSRQLRAMKVLCPAVLCASAVAIYLSCPNLSKSVRCFESAELARVKPDDELLPDRQGQILASRKRRQLPLEIVLVELQPFRNPAPIDRAQALKDPRDLLGSVLDLDLIARAAEERRNVAPGSPSARASAWAEANPNR